MDDNNWKGATAKENPFDDLKGNYDISCICLSCDATRPFMELSFIADDHPFLQNSVKPRRSSVTLKFKMGNQSCSQVHIGIGLEICFGVIHLTLLFVLLVQWI